MPAPFLRTKLFVPQPHPLLVKRPRLIERLESALHLGNRLILLSAPAGYGKTTLICDWIAANQHAGSPAAFCWLSLDADDNDLYRFWRYSIAALQTVHSDIGRELVEQLASSPPPPVAQFLVLLINDLALVQQPLVLVLDDLHVIENKAIQDSLAYVLEHLPEHIHLVLSTRADPSLPLHRLRGRNQLAELRADDLRFTIEEAAAFMNARLDVPLDRKDTELLEARIEGWVTGLQMAALSMQGRQDWRAFLDQFTGSHHYILDYLTEEVISRQPPAVQNFLMQTSIADRFCAALCDALLEPLNAHAAQDGFETNQQILSYLEASNLFLVPLDNEREWFRYHHLFGDLLLARLRQLHPGLAEQLYLRASEWSDAHKLIPEAIRYAIKGKHFERAADLLEQRNMEMWAHSSVIQMRMVNDLPYEVIRRRPVLLLGRLWTLVITGQYDKVLPALNELEQTVRDRPELPDGRIILGFTAAVRAYIFELQGQKADLNELYTNAMGVLNMDRTGVGNTAGFMLGYVLYINGRFEDAEQVLFDSVKTDLADSSTNALPISMSRVGRLRVVAGQMHASARLYQDMLEVIDKRGAWRFYLSGLMNLGLADILLQWNDVDASEEQARIGIARNNDWNIPHAMASGYAALARIQLARGQARLALEMVQSGEEQIGKATILPDARTEIDAARVRALLALGDITAATRFCSEKGWQPEGEMSFRQEMDRICLARVLLARQEWDTTHSMLLLMEAAAEAGGRTGRLIEILVLDALSLFAGGAGQPLPAQAVLQQALRLGEPENYMRIFLDEGEPLARLLWLGSQNGQWQAVQLQPYVDRLLAAFSMPAYQTASAGQEPSGKDQPGEQLVEPLSEREVEVLHLLEQGLSNREIADRLYISTGTVKTHAHNIYSKLCVKNRTQAITRARALGVLRKGD